MHAATRARSVLFASPPCAKSIMTVKFFLQWAIISRFEEIAEKTEKEIALKDYENICRKKFNLYILFHIHSYYFSHCTGYAEIWNILHCLKDKVVALLVMEVYAGSLVIAFYTIIIFLNLYYFVHLKNQNLISLCALTFTSLYLRRIPCKTQKIALLRKSLNPDMNHMGGYPLGPWSQKWGHFALPPKVGGAMLIWSLKMTLVRRYKENFFAIKDFRKI